uniref:Dystroglycan-type cadherin-like domain-containing protein n=1 Tax=Candidatus Kentrum sp. TUN TaxID=2126343 RepID=A0A450ZPG5_9GAMM|nr:MAG: hypothetical protein BECKTUN1418D_GA0071000_10367 [Candidatus Kentron sp. TUN]
MIRKEINMSIGEIVTGSYLGFLALESRIMFDASDGSGGDFKLNDVSHYGGEGKWIYLASENQEINFSDSLDYDYKSASLHFHVEDPNGKLWLNDPSNPNADGAISEYAGNLYLGKGGVKEQIGNVKGEGTNDLTITFSVDKHFTNHDFEDALNKKDTLYVDSDHHISVDAKDWIFQSRGEKSAIMPGITELCGSPVPHRPHEPGNVELVSESVAFDEFIDGKYRISRQFEEGKTWSITRDQSEDGHVLHLKSWDLDVDERGDGLLGPYVCSSELELNRGEVVNFDWNAQAIDDTETAFFYLINTDTLDKDDNRVPAQRIIVDKDNARDSDLGTGWKVGEVVVPDTGNYRFIAVLGSIDESGGKKVGASLQMDNLLVKLSQKTLADIIRQTAYVKSGDGSKEVTITATLDHNSIDKDTFNIISLPAPTTPFEEVDSIFNDTNAHHDFSQGKLVVEHKSNEGSHGRLSIRHQGNGSEEIGRSGKIISYEGKQIGTIGAQNDGENGNPLHIDFNENITSESINALIRNVMHVPQPHALQDNPIISVTNHRGDTHEITVDNKDTYKIPDYVETDIPFEGVNLIGDNTKICQDFAEGWLLMRYGKSKGDPYAQLRIKNQGSGSGQIDRSGDFIRYEGQLIGTVDTEKNGEDGNPLRVDFNENITQEAIQALLQGVAYTHPVPESKTDKLVAIIVDRPDGNEYEITEDNKGTYNIPPAEKCNVITEYPYKGIVIFGDNVKACPDFSEGWLLTEYESEGDSNARLLIRNQGGIEQVDRGNDRIIKYEFVQIGTVDAKENGKDGNSLRIKFNEGVTLEAIRVLLQSVVYTHPAVESGTDRLITTVVDHPDGNEYKITEDNKGKYKICPEKIRASSPQSWLAFATDDDRDFGRPIFPKPLPDILSDYLASIALSGSDSSRHLEFSRETSQWTQYGPGLFQIFVSPKASISPEVSVPISPKVSPEVSVPGETVEGSAKSDNATNPIMFVPNSHVVSRIDCDGLNALFINRNKDFTQDKWFLSDRQFSSDRWFHFQIPGDFFSYTSNKGEVELLAKEKDREELPDWIRFDPTKGSFSGKFPDDSEKQPVTLEVTAREINAGCEVKATFDLCVVSNNAEECVSTSENGNQADYENLNPDKEGDIVDKGNENDNISVFNTDWRVGRPTFSDQLAAAGRPGFEARQTTFMTMSVECSTAITSEASL